MKNQPHRLQIKKIFGNNMSGLLDWFFSVNPFTWEGYGHVSFTGNAPCAQFLFGFGYAFLLKSHKS